MRRKAWKRIFWIALIVLILLLLYTLGLWIFIYTIDEVFAYLFSSPSPGIPFEQFLENLPGTSLPDLYIVDLAVLLCSSVALLVTRKSAAE